MYMPTTTMAADARKAMRQPQAMNCSSHRAAPFAAQADALEHAQQQQQDGRPDADAVVGGHQTDQECGHAHDHQRHHQHAFPADAVAEMAEDQAA
ncbi:hypothetical protein G6F65_021991 [Rhizopus arrhizus]|nr:hypothetical protein G6F65_021991 [Rhizopus arrhizus]